MIINISALNNIEVVPNPGLFQQDYAANARTPTESSQKKRVKRLVEMFSEGQKQTNAGPDEMSRFSGITSRFAIFELLR